MQRLLDSRLSNRVKNIKDIPSKLLANCERENHDYTDAGAFCTFADAVHGRKAENHSEPGLESTCLFTVQYI